MKAIVHRYRTYCAQQEFRVSALLAIAFFLGSLVINFLATSYATSRASNYVEDIVLSNTPVFDVDWFFVYGLLLMCGFVTMLCLAHPQRIPFTLHTLTLFVLIRAVFVSLTHLGPFPSQTAGDVNEYLAHFFFGDDMFFSGHTGAPFLLALIYWHDPVLRYIFLACSVFFGTIVLLGHLHYTIDVLAAFFITFSIYQLAVWLLPKDYALFHSKQHQNLL